jgi:sulfur-oxidizing protein SoxZ
MSRDGVTVVKAILGHPMESGRRRDKETGRIVPAHYIETLDVKHNGQSVLTAELGPAIAKNPLLHFTFKGGQSGDTVEFSWNDSKGENGSFSTTVR